MDSTTVKDEGDMEMAKDWSSLFKPSFVLIALDVHSSMFEAGDDGAQPHFRTCLSACLEIAESLILTQNKRKWSQFGIALTREDGSATLIDFDMNLIDAIKKLKAELKCTDDELADSYQRPAKLDFDLGAFFLLCKKKFKDITQASYRRTIVFITNDDDPVGGDAAKRFRAFNEVKDFIPAELQFTLLTMHRQFDYTKFYNELFSVLGENPVEEFVEDQGGLVDKLSGVIINRRNARKMLFFPFQDDRSRFLRINELKFKQKQKLYNNVHLTMDGRKVKKVIRSEMMVLPGYYLRTFDPRTRLDFDVQEHHELMQNDLPVGYHLMQVSKRQTKCGHVMSRTSPLIEVSSKETLNYFASLWQFCVDNDKVLVCIKKSRHLEKVRFVELIPKFGNGSRLFLVNKIPFADEYRPPPTQFSYQQRQTYEPDANKQELIEKLVTSLSKDYYPEMFVNPVFARKKAFIKAKLLGESWDDEEVQDPTRSTDGVDQRIINFGPSFIASFNLMKKEKRGKRQATSSSTSSKAKRSKK